MRLRYSPFAGKPGALHAVICAAPFFAYGYSLGDEVAIREDGLIGPILVRSDTFTYRVILERRNEDELTQDEMKTLVRKCKKAREELERPGYLVEWHSPSYGAVVAKGEREAEQLVEFLTKKQEAGEWIWESGG